MGPFIIQPSSVKPSSTTVPDPAAPSAPVPVPVPGPLVAFQVERDGLVELSYSGWAGDTGCCPQVVHTGILLVRLQVSSWNLQGTPGCACKMGYVQEEKGDQSCGDLSSVGTAGTASTARGGPVSWVYRGLKSPRLTDSPRVMQDLSR